MKKIAILFLIIFFMFPNKAKSLQENIIDTDAVINSGEQTLKISSILEEAESYKTEALDNINISQILKDAIKGKVETKTIGKNILNILAKNSLSAIKTIASIIVIIVIHSILKSITDGLANSTTTQITYYVTYILIVTIVMQNFADIITMIKESIENLVGFINCLLPILISLMLSTRKYSLRNNVRTCNTICNNSC